MRNIFYKYNPETLSYERVYPSKTKRFWGVFRQFLIGVAIGAALFLIATYYFDSPQEFILKKENKLLETQYKLLSKQLDESQTVLADLQRRDDELYRALFNADPIPASMRNPGVGGSNRYEALTRLPYADLVIGTTAKLDQLNRQLYVQSGSYDELVEMVKRKDERIRCVPAIIPISKKDLRRIGSGFGMRLHPIYGTQKFHSGIDLNAAIGTPFYASGDGVVVTSTFGRGYGNYIVVDHGFGFQSLYAHNRQNMVRVGQKVTRGQQLGTVGMTGDTTGPHLHYEVLVKGVPDNPAKYFFLDLDPAEYQDMLYESVTK